MTASDVPTRPAPVDMSRNPFLTGVFAPQRDEVDATDLPVSGEIPADLRGSYLRNGPNLRFDPIGSYVYPIDGDAMVHRIGFDGGRASYRNRFVRTPMVLAEEAAGHAIWSGITDGYTPSAAEVGDQLAGTVRELPDINIVRHGGRLLAMAEADRPYQLAPADLATLARTDCDGAMFVGSTAHPKIDPSTGELVLFNYVLEAPYLTWAVVGPDGRATREPTPVDGLDAPIMIHDMALTSRYIVLFVCPLVFDIESVMSGGSLLSWQPQRGTRIALIPRDGTAVRWVDADPFWVWHFANAFDNPDGSVTVDYVEWTYPGGFADQPTRASSSLTRAVIRPDAGITKTVLNSTEPDMEFPRVDDRMLTREHHRIASVAKGPRDSGDLDSLWFHDLVAGTEKVWTPGAAIGEPIYIPGAERDYWGAIGTDPTDMTSRFYLLTVDAPEDGPIATVDLPLRVPSGLHGAWLADPSPHAG
ncbi:MULTISPECIES: carotenoid oxygenase family protein [Gordonia]|uniref:carotenoid oxygenase family protein n=1 Tax=Gordonia TaxID=2053 RepID=UPI001331A18F|nr:MULTISPECIES: carotenoid oxygenase family protein [Gordonia]KAF0969391.1 8'-apo-carotenoid 13,14-cleaving dioxygenase [Gordonia sp. YY1]MCZ4578716.1 carotenoid oxygenase family protein [Gordonia amicalis]MCZ4651452.1 carotenoid oxygenase family protein [Gordonia amicalis]UKO91824.1 carotenoid oxygenase family protein [Gordonia amicalis]